MNTMKRLLFRGGTTILTWFGIVAFAATGWAADEQVRIDFRNRIPGVLDAPVFGFDSAARLDGRFLALLVVGNAPNDLVPVSSALQFLSGTNAGYWPYDAVQERVLEPQPALGERIWYQVVIGQYVPDAPFPKGVYVGASAVHSMVVTNQLMPLVELESFSLVPERLEIRRQDEEIIVQWQYLASQKYELQATSGPLPPVLWSPIFEWSGVADTGQTFSVTNAVTATPQFYRLQRWEWP